MDIQRIHAALTTADLKKAAKFYEHLFGRAPDDRRMDSLIQLRGVAGANIQIFHDAQNAGSGRLTIVVPKMEDARKSLLEIGVKPSTEAEGGYWKTADPDGNCITLAEPPKRPY